MDITKGAWSALGLPGDGEHLCLAARAFLLMGLASCATSLPPPVEGPAVSDRLAVEEATDSFIRVAVQKETDIRPGMCVDESLLPSQEACVEIKEEPPKLEDVVLSSGETETYEEMERTAGSASAKGGMLPSFIKPSVEATGSRSRATVVHQWTRYRDWAPQLDDTETSKPGLFVSGVQLGMAAYLVMEITAQSGQIKGEGEGLIVSLRAALAKGQADVAVNCRQVGASGVCASIPARIASPSDLAAALQAFKAATSTLENAEAPDIKVIGYTIRENEEATSPDEPTSE